ncbi:MAG: thioredoxin domain-containing protein [Chloroflexi bacterium]|nr:thioredoxin domain-containing protein [Chloroflexota bacterium]
MAPPDDAPRNPPPHTNRLADETSPYLLQHQHNPVDWQAWGDDAWQRARDEDKPVLVSIGYAACHWCHVMERESFEDEGLAARQNELFVSIKVDREERPDVDEIYMEAVQLMRGQGGWPLNVFCLPDGRPFFGGTYFPPVARQGMPSWRQVLDSVAAAYRERRADLEGQAAQIVAHLEQAPGPLEPGEERADPAAARRAAVAQIMKSYDKRFGGFGGAPKFPQPFFLALVLQHAVADNHPLARDQVLATLRQMAEGGIYDQLGGGFHRYSVDEHWLVPHFEKMLYDNALLVPLFLDAARLSDDSFFSRIAEETLDYLLREMRTPEGAFYASTDADSEGEEGKYFVWSLDEVTALLGDDAPLFARYYDVTEDGNFEGRNILHPRMPLAQAAAWYQQEEDAAAERLASARATLLAARAGRVPPATDTKVIAAWNGMAIDALARGGAILDAPRFIDAAREAAAFLLETMRPAGDAGGLLRIFAGGRASVPGFLEDYAGLADGLLSLYEATGEERWFIEARQIADAMLTRYWDRDAGGFFTTGSRNEALVSRKKPTYDGATASGNSQAARVLARLYAMTGEGLYADRLEAMAGAFGVILTRAPVMMSGFVAALDWLHRHRAVAVVGDDADPATQALVRAVWDGPPGPTLVMRHAPGEGHAESTVPQLQGKTPLDGAPAAYVCHGFACSAPVTTPEALRGLLGSDLPA